MKYGSGTVTVQRAVAAFGIGSLTFIEGNMGRYKYKSLLEHTLKPSVNNFDLGSG